ncbi:MAG: hypothetical protein J6X02_01635 [Bacilli bacterium]|nr:hypothetical protein [Bacilli bacterium]
MGYNFDELPEYTKTEIGRIRDRIRKYEEAATKLDGLDPETKATILMSLKESIARDELNIKVIENNFANMSDVIKK